MTINFFFSFHCYLIKSIRNFDTDKTYFFDLLSIILQIHRFNLFVAKMILYPFFRITLTDNKLNLGSGTYKTSSRIIVHNLPNTFACPAIIHSYFISNVIPSPICIDLLDGCLIFEGLNTFFGVTHMPIFH